MADCQTTLFTRLGGFARGIRSLGVVAIILAALFASGCMFMEKKLGPAPPTRKVAVLDFKIPELYLSHDKMKHGWWFGAHTLSFDRFAGTRFPDDLTRQLNALSYIDARSRIEIKLHFSRKADVLRKAFPGRKDEEYERMFFEVSPAVYGRELGVDLVVSGEVLDAHTYFQHFLQSMHSRARVRVDYWSVETGEVFYSSVQQVRLSYESLNQAYVKLAEKAVRDADRQFFRSEKQ
jgi:hypothetical protein